MDYWTEGMISIFLKKLEQLPCLWDGQCSNYKNPTVRANALVVLSQHMNITGCGAQMMHQKMNQLRGIFIREKRRMYELRKAGQPFTPRFRWYYIADNFWGKVIKIRKHTFYDDEDIRPQNSTENAKGPSEDSTGLLYMSKAVSAIRHVTALSSGNEYEAFGRSVACQLKNMQPMGAYELQSEIQNMITKKKIKCLIKFRPKSPAKLEIPPTSELIEVCKEEDIIEVVDDDAC